MLDKTTTDLKNQTKKQKTFTCSGFTHLTEAKTRKLTDRILAHAVVNHYSVSATGPGFLFLILRFHIAAHVRPQLDSDFGFLSLFFTFRMFVHI